MKDYIATFHTHLAALMTSRNLTALGIQARMMPVPRRLSASCGTCVRYCAPDASLEAMDEDVEGVYELGEGDTYVQLLHNE
ncbi:MAG: DUF3343 domain-containing protein [Oscillospiraceae bacterium]